MAKSKDEGFPITLNSLDDIMDTVLNAKRIVFLTGSLGYDDGPENAAEVSYIAKKLEYLAHLSNEPIKFIINSPVGDVFEGLLLYDTIQGIVKSGIKVVTEARGLAASMGCILLQAGSERTATRHSRLLIHEVSSVAYGKSSEMEEQVEETKRVNDMMKRILAEKTGMTSDQIEKLWHKKDVWLSSDDALKMKLIDRIV